MKCDTADVSMTCAVHGMCLWSRGQEVNEVGVLLPLQGSKIFCELLSFFPRCKVLPSGLGVFQLDFAMRVVGQLAYCV